MKANRLAKYFGPSVLSLALTCGTASPSPAATAPAAKPAPNPAAAWAKAKLELNENIRAINQIMATPGLQLVGMDNLARQTGVAADTIEATRRKSAMSYGDLAAGLLLAKAANVPFEQIKQERRGRSWADIAAARRIALAGVNEKLAAVKLAVDQFVAKHQEDEANRAMAEERRMMRLHGVPPPPPPPPPPAELPSQPRPPER
ncbi:MAG: hypothetical protein N3J91_02840 [Verrucomicrobiae bacterium]|nr:hypothetical protein [Verrucomicrobiae bacterium]